jgi:MFS family permease
VIVYLSHWFVQKDRAKALSNFMGAIPLSSVLGAPLAGWILGHAWLGVQGWRWLFIVEGVPAILLGVLAFFFLTDWPREAGWLTYEQRQWVEQELGGENAACGKAITVWQALKCRPILLLASIPFFSYFAMYCFQFWFPTILKRQSGFSDFRVGLIGALPFVAYFIAMQFNGWQNRGATVALGYPSFHGGGCSLGLLISNPFRPILDCLLHGGGYRCGISADVLDHSNRNFEQIQCSHRRGIDQCNRQHLGFCRSL